MVFADLIASISERLPVAGAEMCARARTGELYLDPAVGLAAVDLSSGGEASGCTIDAGNLLRDLGAPVIGMVGRNPVAKAVADYALAALGTSIIYWDVAESTAGTENGARFVRLEEMTQLTDVFCFALPWAGEITDWLRWYHHRPGQARRVVVAWHRSRAVERALAYLGRNLADAVQLSALATHVGLSRFHLLRLFRATLGITPHRCQLLLRLSCAKAMLREGTEISEVAFALGFCDQSHLSRTFRMLAGAGPREYQPGGGNFFQDNLGAQT